MVRQRLGARDERGEPRHRRRAHRRRHARHATYDVPSQVSRRPRHIHRCLARGARNVGGRTGNVGRPVHGSAGN
eukprot:6083946-Prymnesium_polylepis.1